MMLFVIECILLCGVFTVLILIPQFKNPLSQIASYPPAIQKRVASLPQYKNTFQGVKQKNITRKIVGTLLLIFIFAAIAFYSGSKTFAKAFIYVFALFFVVNMFDLFVLDIIVFANSKKVIIPGTEDMVKEYKSPWHHVKGACKGIIIGTLVAALSGGLVAVFSRYL